MGNPSLGFPTVKPSTGGLASLPELLGFLKISPIAMGEEGLRPSTPPPLKRWTKLLCFFAGNWVPFLGQPQSATCPTAGGEKA